MAEVLITLGIIGIVAAMTMPTLMAKESVFNVSNMSMVATCNQFTEIACLSEEHRKGFQVVSDSNTDVNVDTLPQNYQYEGEDITAFKWEDVPYIFTTADGMVYGVLPDEEAESFSVVVDTNGARNPNNVQKDLYKFRVSGNGLLSDVTAELLEKEVDACAECSRGPVGNSIQYHCPSREIAAACCEQFGERCASYDGYVTLYVR